MKFVSFQDGVTSEEASDRLLREERKPLGMKEAKILASSPPSFLANQTVVFLGAEGADPVVFVLRDEIVVARGSGWWAPGVLFAVEGPPA